MIIVPPRISSLLTPSRQAELEQHRLRSVSAASQLSADLSTSDFLSSKIDNLGKSLDYIACIKDSILEAKDQNTATNSELLDELHHYLKHFRSSTDTLHIVKRQQKLIAEDLDEAAESSKKRSCLIEPNNQGLLERAYTGSIIPRVMSACAKQKKTNFNQNAFNKAVKQYYGVSERFHGWSYCHILGQKIQTELAKAAHLVPKSLSSDELSHLFGVDDPVLTDPRNGESPMYS